MLYRIIVLFCSLAVVPVSQANTYSFSESSDSSSYYSSSESSLAYSSTYYYSSMPYSSESSDSSSSSSDSSSSESSDSSSSSSDSSSSESSDSSSSSSYSSSSESSDSSSSSSYSSSSESSDSSSSSSYSSSSSSSSSSSYALTACFTASPVSGAIAVNYTDDTYGLEVSFNASCTVSTAGITSYSWSFGDTSTGTGSTIDHSYADDVDDDSFPDFPTPGSYIVTLTVTDSTGNTSTATKTITVNEPAIPDIIDPVYAEPNAIGQPVVNIGAVSCFRTFSTRNTTCDNSVDDPSYKCNSNPIDLSSISIGLILSGSCTPTISYHDIPAMDNPSVGDLWTGSDCLANFSFSENTANTCSIGSVSATENLNNGVITENGFVAAPAAITAAHFAFPNDKTPPAANIEPRPNIRKLLENSFWKNTANRHESVKRRVKNTASTITAVTSIFNDASIESMAEYVATQSDQWTLVSDSAPAGYTARELTVKTEVLASYYFARSVVYKKLLTLLPEFNNYVGTNNNYAWDASEVVTADFKTCLGNSSSDFNADPSNQYTYCKTKFEKSAPYRTARQYITHRIWFELAIGYTNPEIESEENYALKLFNACAQPHYTANTLTENNMKGCVETALIIQGGQLKINEALRKGKLNRLPFWN